MSRTEMLAMVPRLNTLANVLLLKDADDCGCVDDINAIWQLM